MTGTPPKISPELAVAIAESDTESLEAELSTLRVTENGLARRLNAARRSARAIEIELRRRARGGAA